MGRVRVDEVKLEDGRLSLRCEVYFILSCHGVYHYGSAGSGKRLSG